MLDSLVYDYIIISRSVEWLKKQIDNTCSEIDKAKKNNDSKRLELLYSQLQTLYGRTRIENENMDRWLERYQELRLLHAA